MKNFGSYQVDKNTYEFNQEPLFLQSEYFNVHFQKALEDLGDGLDLKEILGASAHEVAYSQFSSLFKQNEKWDLNERKQIVSEYFAACGFGKLDLKPIQAKGGHIEIHHEHYASAWVRHFGVRSEEKPAVGHFALGFLCGMVEALFDTKPGLFDGKQETCISKGDSVSRFEVFRGFKRKINHSPGLGKPAIVIEDVVKPNESLIDAFIEQMMSASDNDSGWIEQFDTTFTKHYVNYYALVEIRLLMLANKKLGPNGLKSVRKELTEVSQKNAYFTFGKILNSEFWQKELKSNEGMKSASSLENTLDLISAMGFGHWQAEETGDPNQFKVVIRNCPRTNAYLKLVGNTKASIGFMNGSMLSGIAAFLENGESQSKSIDNDYVDSLAASNHFTYAEESSRMTGGDQDVLIAKKP